ncbi:MAG: hypothetical protein JSS61_02650 [Verrucomicrobia bacterium]|nr:hypothetical protein [Verrucomicrobiota bacterium]
MSYDAFLLVMGQLTGSRKARVLIDERYLIFETNLKRDRWTISTTVFSGEAEIPPAVLSCISSRGTFRWEDSGCTLKMDPDTHSIQLLLDVPFQMGKYLPFRSHVTQFLSIANQWRSMFEEIAEFELI